MRKINKEQITKELWRRGDLDFLRRPEQKKMKASFESQIGKIRTLLCSRRLGKTFDRFLEAAEVCIKKNYAVVKYLFPEKSQATKILEEVGRQVFETCPEELKPEWQSAKQIYLFPNGSQIQIGCVDDRGGDSLRGGAADMCVVDEIGFADSKYVTYAVRSVLRPTILHSPNARIYLVSTPPKTSNHAFWTEYVKPLLSQNKLQKLTIYASSVLNDDDIKEIAADYPLGLQDPEFLREYMCEMSDDVASKILPEVTPELLEKIVIDSYELPPFYDYYVSGDIGFKDLTVFLLGYWNFQHGKLVILDEVVVHGPSIANQSLTQVLSAELKQKKKDLFGDKKVYMEVMDNDLIVINNLNIEHQFNFSPTQKDNKEGAVNSLRLMLNNNQILIHSRCKHLLYHMQYGEWQDSSTKIRGFKRIPDSSDKLIRGGHCDAVDALVYMARNVVKSHNPFPKDYGMPDKDHFWQLKKQNDVNSKQTNDVKQLLNIKEKDPNKKQGFGFMRGGSRF